jgi:hypothetical protein
MPSAPKTLERYIEKIKPSIPVVILDDISKKEFFTKLSLAKVSSLL